MKLTEPDQSGRRELASWFLPDGSLRVASPTSIATHRAGEFNLRETAGGIWLLEEPDGRVVQLGPAPAPAQRN